MALTAVSETQKFWSLNSTLPSPKDHSYHKTMYFEGNLIIMFSVLIFVCVKLQKSCRNSSPIRTCCVIFLTAAAGNCSIHSFEVVFFQQTFQRYSETFIHDATVISQRSRMSKPVQISAHLTSHKSSQCQELLLPDSNRPSDVTCVASTLLHVSVCAKVAVCRLPPKPFHCSAVPTGRSL